MTDISRRLAAIRATLPEGVALVAVSKFHPVEELRQAYDAGQRAFGESRIQELTAKIPQLPSDVMWHFIGHLQSNKVRQLVATGRVALIESIDSERLLRLVDQESLRAGTVSRVLLQVHVAAEETKFGFSPDELMEFFRNRGYESLRATHICGLMGMATNTDDTTRVKADFAAIATLRRNIIAECPDLRGFDTLSMGMSDDYPLAIAEGANLVRIGTALFGPREY
ncbi:MAG: YggS family pyridoxal phosphate-dependent enzyme [Muribaculaceae bacterium]|nr:YggS family pyridoxal phosphate-dependent enzyme [Muribaculaceae bacterium]MDE6135625.1 YggS family pyridoxal phosphate-dependent enzyme [Muribaculaceae bacterium]